MTRTARWIGSASALAMILASSPAYASGTTAGTTITNTATVNYNDAGGVFWSAGSNVVATRLR